MYRLNAVTGREPGYFSLHLQISVQALVEDRRKRIDVLVPGAIEIAEEQQIVVLQIFARLLFRKGAETRSARPIPSARNE